MPKERSVNPATAALKQQKQRSIKKNKALQTSQRTEKLARRNPDRLQSQIDALTSQRDAQGGSLRPKDQQTLEALEKDLKMVKKARELRGDERPQQDRRDRRDQGPGRGGSVLGKRGRDTQSARHQDSETETDEDVRAIPMPRDTPPPIPPRRVRDAPRQGRHGDALPDQKAAFAARDQTAPAAAPAQPPRTTYEAAPMIRDLRKEATSRFVPAAVAAKQKARAAPAGAGGRLPEPEELDRMEQEAAARGSRGVGADVDVKTAVDLDEEERALQMELADEAGQDAADAVAEAEKEAEYEMMADAAETGERRVGASGADRALNHVEMEEVSDEDG